MNGYVVKAFTCLSFIFIHISVEFEMQRQTQQTSKYEVVLFYPAVVFLHSHLCPLSSILFLLQVKVITFQIFTIYTC